MSVKVEQPFTAPGHHVHFRSREPDPKSLPLYWLECECGWSTAPETVNVGHTGIARDHLAPYVPHDLEVRESADSRFARAACTCGWESDEWHRQTWAGVSRTIRGEHSMHCAAVKYAAAQS